MKTFLRNYWFGLVGLIVIVAVVVYDYYLYWPSWLNFLEKNVWLWVSPFLIPVLLNMYLVLTRKDRSQNNSIAPHFSKNYFKGPIAIGIYSVIVISLIIITIIQVLPDKESDDDPKFETSSVDSSSDSYEEESTELNEPNEPSTSKTKESSPDFNEGTKSPFEPDALIITKSLSDLPKDIAKSTILGKLINKETIFYYKDEPGVSSLLGTLKRIAYEHKLNFSDNIIKEILDVPAEVSFWKGTDGKLKDFTLIASVGRIKDTVLSAYLALKKMGHDKHVSKFTYNSKVGYRLTTGNRELTIFSDGEKICITTLGEKFLPWNNEKKQKEIYLDRFDESHGKGFYSNLYGIQESDQKHVVLFSANYISFGYQYFFPSVSAIRFDFEKKWKILSLSKSIKDNSSRDSQTLWTVLPKSPALCIAVPVASTRVSDFAAKYIASFDIKKEDQDKIFSKEDVETLVQTPFGICWYKDSSLYTPVFAVGVNKIVNMKAKLLFMFKKFVGGLEAKKADGSYYEALSPQVVDTKSIYKISRSVSSRYAFDSPEVAEDKIGVFRSNRIFNIKLAYIGDFLIFSPDGKLVDHAVDVYEKKAPSVNDELNAKSKNISLIIFADRLSSIIKSYMEDALPQNQESVLRNTVERHLFKSFSKLRKVVPFAVQMPKKVEGKWSRWENLSVIDL